MKQYNVYTSLPSAHSVEDVNLYAYLGPSEFKTIFGKKKKQMTSPDLIYGCVKICANGRSVYRKYHGDNNLKGDMVQLDYSTQCELGNPKMVTIRPTSARKYAWHNSNYTLRNTYKMATVSVVLGVISMVLTVFFGILTLLNECLH